jgi:DNA-binding HxlR family transcriptional regulator
MVKREDMPVCDVATAVQVIGSKWKLLILRELMTGPKRNGELLHTFDGLSQKVLTESLKGMIEDGIVERKEFEGKVKHVEYSLSELGESLRPVIDTMREWGRWYKEQL